REQTDLGREDHRHPEPENRDRDQHLEQGEAAALRLRRPAHHGVDSSSTMPKSASVCLSSSLTAPFSIRARPVSALTTTERPSLSPSRAIWITARSVPPPGKK